MEQQVDSIRARQNLSADMRIYGFLLPSDLFAAGTWLMFVLVAALTLLSSYQQPTIEN